MNANQMLVFEERGNRITRRKPLGAEKRTNKLNPHMTPSLVMHQSIPAVPIPPPPRANPRALAIFFKKWVNSPGWGHISCVNALGWGRRKRANAPSPGSSPSNRRLYSQATLSVKNQDILNDLSSHFTLARSVLKIASFEFVTLQCFI